MDGHVCRVPVFEERIDNIVGIAYAMDLLDYVQKVYYLLFCISSKMLFLHFFSDCTKKSLITCRIMFCLVLKGELLESSVVGDMAHKPAYFVPGN